MTGKPPAPIVPSVDLSGRPSAQLARAKEGLLALERPRVRWNGLPDDLVLLREISGHEVDRAARELAKGLAAHRMGLGPVLRGGWADPMLGVVVLSTLRAEHVALEGSMEELEGLIALVRADGHGGNRQALGQYWRLLWDALDRHLGDERILLAMGP